MEMMIRKKQDNARKPNVTSELSTVLVDVTVNESVCEEDGSDDEEKGKDIEDSVCQLLDQRMASQHRDKSCVALH